MFSSSVNSNFPRRRNPEVRHGSASGRKNIASVVLSTTIENEWEKLRELSSTIFGSRRWCHASCVVTHSSSSGVFCCDVLLLLRRWFHASCVATYPSSSGVGFTRLVLRRTPPPPALVSRVWCGDVPLLTRKKYTTVSFGR